MEQSTDDRTAGAENPTPDGVSMQVTTESLTTPLTIDVDAMPPVRTDDIGVPGAVVLGFGVGIPLARTALVHTIHRYKLGIPQARQCARAILDECQRLEREAGGLVTASPSDVAAVAKHAAVTGQLRG